VNVETRVCTCRPIDIKCLPTLDSLSSPWSHLLSNVLILFLHLNPQNLPILSILEKHVFYHSLNLKKEKLLQL